MISVVTPTYNSAKLIHRVYESLQNQTYRDFEWIVVNDGSTDNTGEVVRQWIDQKPDFPIYYFEQPNGGKGSACNLGVAHAKGEFLVIADADDRFVPEAFETFLRYWHDYAEKEGDLGTLWCNCVTQHGKFHGSPFKESPLAANLLDLMGQKGVDGEKWLFFKTEVIRAYPFNTTVDCHVPPSHVWHAMAEKYRSLFINETLRIYYVDQKDHVSIKSEKRITYPAGRRFRDLEVINKYLHRVWPNKRYVKTVIKDYIRMSIHLGMGLGRILNDVDGWKKKLLILISYPKGWYAARRDRTKGRI